MKTLMKGCTLKRKKGNPKGVKQKDKGWRRRKVKNTLGMVRKAKRERERTISRS